VRGRISGKSPYSNGVSPLKLHLAANSGQNVFTGYGDDYVLVNNARYESSVVVLPDRVIESWKVPRFEELEARHFEFLCELDPEVVLLGTGASLRFPHPRITRCLTDRRIGLEVMDSHAVCRTYNILAAEGRHVLAAVLPCTTAEI
jgi:uncharacterized protein